MTQQHDYDFNFKEEFKIYQQIGTNASCQTYHDWRNHILTKYRSCNCTKNSAECGVSIPLEDVISLCGTITDAIAPQNSYTADTVLPYGNQGRRPYYTIFFRRTAGGMPIIGYNDLYFFNCRFH